MQRSPAPGYPFAAIVGQEPMRLALLLNAVDPRIGGVLIRGEKGTAKSTMARALASLLPAQRVVAGCPYGCDPDDPTAQDVEHRGRADLPVSIARMRVVELPTNATEDRVVGSLDVRAALGGEGFRFQPGLLAEANRNILYVDEANLLPDHLVDLVLDAAASGRVVVEREGVSVSHPARVLLIGTMNPEEGDLRPQLLDRFGLCVDVTGIDDVDGRVAVMQRRAAFERDPVAFAAAWRAADADLRERVLRARALLPSLHISEELLRLVAGLSLELGVDGHRADLVTARTATALAAFEGRTAVTREDVRRAAELALPHRTRRRPFEHGSFTPDRLQQAMDDLQPPPEPDMPDGEDDSVSDLTAADHDDSTPAGHASDQRPDQADQAATPAPPRADTPPPKSDSKLRTSPSVPSLTLGRDRTARTGTGRQQRSASADERGRVIRAELPGGPATDIAVAATVRTTVSHAPGLGASLTVVPADLRVNVRERTVGATIVFVVDASGSMGAAGRIEAARGAAVSLLTEAYQRRDRVAVVTFRGADAEIVLPPTASVELAHERLTALHTGGRTPLAAGLATALDVIRQVRLKDPRAICVPTLLTDGKANVSAHGGSPVDDALAAAARLQGPGIYPLVLDTESGGTRLGLAEQIAAAAGARYVRLADLTAEGVAASVRSMAADATA